MNLGRTVFSQLVDFLPTYQFQICVDRYQGNRYVKGFSCWDQFLCLAFAQLTYREVRNVLSDRIEAMKVLLPALADQKELAVRFLREIKVLASLNHPNIAALRTALMMDNQLVMIMEYVEGTTLAARVAQAPIFWKDAANYVD